ncbi:hypothetical protein Cgig2_016651 [Carnegiea gigantea]|uniref:Uncharacterized protein n=1 Tax=Carnegiea gigantea TaxID=171969 RepID=A0A9Q1QTU2_9CARY|nr:hypothetical protein Cgig2_016651 [Carnegiea gigantea]
MSSIASYHSILLPLLVLLPLTTHVAGECTCEAEDLTHDPNNITIKYKIGAIIAILISSAIGVSLPIAGRNVPALTPGSNLFFLIKAFAAGVILSTGFIHILPDAFETLTSPCLKEDPWGKFPFTGLAAMVGALGTLTIEAFATGYYGRAHEGGIERVNADEEKEKDMQMHLHIHGHSHSHSHGHGGGSIVPGGLSDLDRIKYKVTSQK